MTSLAHSSPPSKIAEADLVLLQASPFWQELGAAQQELILNCASVDSFEAGATLFCEGEMPEHGFISLSGRVSLLASHASGTEGVIDIFGAGQLFLMTSIVLNMPYLATARAAGPLRTLRIPVTQLRNVLTSDLRLSNSSLRHMALQMRLMINQLRGMKLLSANERLAHYLLSRVDADKGPAIVELQKERRVIAQRLAMKPESLSRAIAALRETGVIFNNRQVKIENVESLHNFCGLNVIP